MRTTNSNTEVNPAIAHHLADAYGLNAQNSFPSGIIPTQEMKARALEETRAKRNIEIKSVDLTKPSLTKSTLTPAQKRVLERQTSR